MENWEKDHIRKNLPELLKNTICSPDFLSRLVADGTLGSADTDALNCIGNKREQVQHFYEIVQTRRGGYSKLKNALVATSQTGVSTILDRWNPNNATNPYKNYGTITYDKNEVIGQGCFSTTVYKGQFKNRVVAVKVISIRFVNAATATREVDVLTKLDGHANVVRYYNTEDSVLIALELCHANLHDWVTKPRTIEIGVVELLKQITKGIQYLHLNRIVHRDLKPANILLMNLVGGRVYVKISDFGLSRKISDGMSRLSKHSSGVGTEGWLAPEVAQQMEDEASSDSVLGMSLASDIFALGCIFYFVLSEGVHPFGGPVMRQANILLGKHKLDPEKMTALPDKALAFIWLIRHMMAHKEAERPTASDVLAHHAFWSSKTTLHFLEEVYPFIDSCSAMVNGSFDLVVEPGTSQDLASLFCPILQQFLKDLRNISVDGLSFSQLFQLLVRLWKNQFNLPNDVKGVLGRNADEFLSYWENRFPYLLPIGWTCFQYVKEQKDAINQHYQSNGSEFRFRLVRHENGSFSIKPFPIDMAPGVVTENSRDYSLLETNQESKLMPASAAELELQLVRRLLPDMVHFYNDEMKRFLEDALYDPEVLTNIHKNLSHSLSSQFKLLFFLNDEHKKLIILELKSSLDENFPLHVQINSKNWKMKQAKIRKCLQKMTSLYMERIQNVLLQNPQGLPNHRLERERDEIVNMVRKKLGVEISGNIREDEPLDGHLDSLQAEIDECWGYLTNRTKMLETKQY